MPLKHLFLPSGSKRTSLFHPVVNSSEPLEGQRQKCALFQKHNAKKPSLTLLVQKIWGPASKCAGPLASPSGTCVSSCIGRSPLWGHPSTPLRGSECRCRESNVRNHLERQELRHTLKQALLQRTSSCALKHLSASSV